MTSPVFPWEVYGRTWHLRRPPFEGQEPDTLTVGILADLIVAHLPAAEVEDFRRLLADDEDLNVTVLEAMLDAVHDIVSPDISRPSMRFLLDEFEKVRPLIHGQLLRAGHPGGAEGMNTYDAACVALAFMDEDFREVPGFSVNEKGRPALLDQLSIGRKPVTDLDALKALQAMTGMAEGQTSARPARKPDSARTD